MIAMLTKLPTTIPISTATMFLARAGIRWSLGKKETLPKLSALFQYQYLSVEFSMTGPRGERSMMVAWAYLGFSETKTLEIDLFAAEDTGFEIAELP
jgi:hypothetical protein